MAGVDYYYTVGDTVTTSNTWGTVTNIGTTSSCTVANCNCSGWHYTWYPYTYGHTCPSPIKLYQILCPKPGCTGKFWAEVDEIKPCPVCKKKIKITDKPLPDYEVEVS